MHFTGDLSKDSKAIQAAEAQIQRQKRYNETIHLRASVAAAGLAADGASSTDIVDSTAAGGVELLSKAKGTHRAAKAGGEQRERKGFVARPASAGVGEPLPPQGIEAQGVHDSPTCSRHQQHHRTSGGGALPPGVPRLKLESLAPSCLSQQQQQQQQQPLHSHKHAAALLPLPEQLARVAESLPPALLRSCPAIPGAVGSCSDEVGSARGRARSSRGGSRDKSPNHSLPSQLVGSSTTVSKAAGGSERERTPTPSRPGGPTPHPAADEWGVCAASSLSSRRRQELHVTAVRPVSSEVVIASSPAPVAAAAPPAAAAPSAGPHDSAVVVPRLRLEAVFTSSAAASARRHQITAAPLLGPDAVLPASAHYLNALTSARSVPPGQLLLSSCRSAGGSGRGGGGGGGSSSQQQLSGSNAMKKASATQGRHHRQEQQRHGRGRAVAAVLTNYGSRQQASPARRRTSPRIPSPPPRLSYCSAAAVSNR